MSNKDFTHEDYIEQFGTEEQKKEWQERKEKFEEWINQFPVLTLEEAMKQTFGREKYK